MLDIFVNFLHLLATAVWIGGMVFLSLVLQPPVRLTAVKRFSVISWICLLVLLVTGYIKTPERMFFDFSYSPAIFLAVKHILILLMILVGLAITVHVVPALQKNTPGPGEAPSAVFLRSQKRLSTLSLANLAFSVLVLACASMLW